ncbi:MAG: hypothetical protein E7612_07385 [Ruminococcaceae bacterium]|nr:hypothetical protein [Oscillospiraceae bacterium]
MFRKFDTANGIPPRLYRSPSEIKSDIRKISASIEETSSMLNIRELLLNILMSERASLPEKIIPELWDAINEANLALSSLRELKEELDSLEDELREVRWLLGR